MHRSLIVPALILTLFAVQQSRADLVTNGGFETGDFTGWSTQDASSGSGYGVGIASPHSGTWYAIFAAVEGIPDQIYQVLSTTSGQQYTLSFWLDNLYSGSDSFKVLWEGTTVLDLTPVDSANDGYKQYTLNLTAGTSGSELRFAAYDAPWEVLLDDVSVEAVAAVPTPASSALGLIGLGICLVRRRRMV